MPLTDLFSNSLITPVLNWAKNQNLPEVAGSLLAAYAIPALAGRLVRKQHRGAVQGMLAQPLIANAFGALQRPQQQKEFLLKQQIEEQGLTTTPPYTGAPSVLEYGGMPLYASQIIGQKYPDMFPDQSPYPKTLTSPQFTPPGSEIAPSSLKPIPDVKPLLASERVLMGQPANKAAIPMLLKYFQEKEEEVALQKRMQQSASLLSDFVKNNSNLVLIPGMSDRGFSTATVQQRKQGAGEKDPTVYNLPVVTQDGQEVTQPSIWDRETKKMIPLPGTGGSRFKPNTGTETTASDKRKAFLKYDQDHIVPEGWTKTDYEEWIGRKSPNNFVGASNIADLGILNKKIVETENYLTPFASLLKKYPDGNIPTKEFLDVADGLTQKHPLYNATDSTSLRDLQAQLAELQRDKQRLVDSQGGQPQAPAATPAASALDLYRTFKK